MFRQCTKETVGVPSGTFRNIVQIVEGDGRVYQNLLLRMNNDTSSGRFSGSNYPVRFSFSNEKQIVILLVCGRILYKERCREYQNFLHVFKCPLQGSN